MARDTPRPTHSGGTALIASAARVTDTRSFNTTKKADRSHIEELWDLYDQVGEYRFACDWVGSMLSRAKLYVVRKNDKTRAPVLDHPATRILDALFGDDEGRSEMLKMIGTHATVAGEWWLVGYEDDDGVDVWDIVATGSLQVQGGKNSKVTIDGDNVGTMEDVYLSYMWVPHPRRRKEPKSPSKAQRPVIREIKRLTEHVDAQIDSRLAGAGILFMPNNMEFPKPPPPVNETGEDTVVHNLNTAEEVMAVIQDAMEASLTNRGHASARVPIVITAPPEAIEAVHHMTFWTELDKQAVELRNEAISRLALGMDMPPEVLTGVADVNHWSAWQSDESAIKAHTEPLLKRLCVSLTKAYLLPLLREEHLEEGDDPEQYAIVADTSEMRLRPNRSKEALELYDRGELGGEALLRETGFDRNDAMGDKERIAWLTRKVASGSTTPELVAAALDALGVKLNVAPEPSKLTEARPTPSLLQHPEQDIPERREAAALLVGGEQIAFRALERAGNKIRNRKGRISGVSAADQYLFVDMTDSEIDFYLDDAFGRNVDVLAAACGVPAPRLSAALDRYCRMLFATKGTHDFATFSTTFPTILEEVTS